MSIWHIRHFAPSIIRSNKKIRYSLFEGTFLLAVLRRKCYNIHEQKFEVRRVKERVILHCDLDNFFASVECVFEPKLKDVPMAVCGSESDRHGVVLAKNQIAKKYGIKTAETVWQAKKKCPDLVTVPPHMEEYRKFSKRAVEIYLKYTDMVEQFSIDECWLDVTGSQLLFGTPEEIAQKIQNDMKNQLGLTVSIGISFNKYFAKFASDVNKPDGYFSVYADEFKEKMENRPIEELMGVGTTTRQKLQSMGIYKIGELYDAPQELLKRLLGKHGAELWKCVHGLDESPVRHYAEHQRPKSVGRSKTLHEDTRDIAQLKSILACLCDDISASLRAEGLYASTVQIQLKDNLFKVSQYQKKLLKPTRIANELFCVGTELLCEDGRIKNPIRLIGITAGALTDDNMGYQLSFTADEQGDENKENLDSKVDCLRAKYGKSIIKRASQIK